MTRSIVLFLILGSVVHTTAWAHSIRFDVTEHPPVVTVHAYFSMTSPVADASVEVFAPGRDVAYQHGRTDRAGYFAFVPSGTGEWIVRVDDERGHRGRTVVRITDAFFQPEQAEEVLADPAAGARSADDSPAGAQSADDMPSAASASEDRAGRTPATGESPDQTSAYSMDDIPLGYRILLGLALIFGVTGFWYGIKARWPRNETSGNSN